MMHSMNGDINRNSNLDMSNNEPISEIENPQTNEEVYQGSLRGVIARNLGVYVIIEFLIGTNNIVIKDGILYASGNNYVTLYQEDSNRYVLCDLYAIKFINFYDARTKPKNLRNVPTRMQPSGRKAPACSRMRALLLC